MKRAHKHVRHCRVCGCTDHDCSRCIERQGEPCHWVEDDLCSACMPQRIEMNLMNSIISCEKYLDEARSYRGDKHWRFSLVFLSMAAQRLIKADAEFVLLQRAMRRAA